MKPEHLKIEAGESRYSVPGGQHCGVSTGVRVTHIPTGLMAYCDAHRTQKKNLNVCCAMLEWGIAEIGWKGES